MNGWRYVESDPMQAVFDLLRRRPRGLSSSPPSLSFHPSPQGT